MQVNFGTLINSLLVAIIIFYVYFYPKIKAARGKDRRRDTIFPKNPNDKPGKAQECLKHMKKLTEFGNEIKNIKDDITEIKNNNRDDHREIFREINKVRNQRR